MHSIFDQLALPDNLRAPLLLTIGASPDDDAETFAAITWEMYQTEVVANFQFEDGRAPSIFEKTRLLRFHKELTKIFSDVPLAAAPVVAAPPQNIVVTLPETPNELPMRNYIDQTSTEKFTMLSEDELRQLRQRYYDATGMEPLAEERPSDQQLSALAHLLRPKKDQRVHAPFVEFAVFGPYNGRSAKMRAFTAQVFNRDGSLVTRTLRRPESFPGKLLG